MERDRTSVDLKVSTKEKAFFGLKKEDWFGLIKKEKF